MPVDKRYPVKATLANLFRSELGFVKGANLAGLMTSKLLSEAKGENNAQRAISILTTVSSYFYRTSGSKDDVAAYLWSHQKAMGKRGWFFSISDSDRAVLDASQWYQEKARQLSQLLSEERFYRSLT
jgi:hypothetical protein